MEMPPPRLSLSSNSAELVGERSLPTDSSETAANASASISSGSLVNRPTDLPSGSGPSRRGHHHRNPRLSPSTGGGSSGAVLGLTTIPSDDSDDETNAALPQSPPTPNGKYHRQSFTLTEMLGLFAVSFSYAFCFNTLNTIVIPKEIERLTSTRQSMWVGLVMATGAISQLATPIVGAWSDKAGQRTPYLVYGTFIAIIGIVCFLFAESFNEVLFLMIAHVTTTVGLSVQYSMVTALLNDYVPEEHTGKGSGAMAILAIFGSGAGYILFAFNTPLTYSYCAYILASVMCLGICVIYIPTPSPGSNNSNSLQHSIAASTQPTMGRTARTTCDVELGGVGDDGGAAQNAPVGLSSAASGVSPCQVTTPPDDAVKKVSISSAPPTTAGWLDSILSPLSMPSPSRFPDFFFACFGRALFNSGLAGQVYLVYYLRDIIGASNPVQITSMVAVMALLGGVVGALPSGVISDRVGKKPVIYGSITICVTTLLSFMIVRDVTSLHIVGFFYGVGNVAYLSVDYALGVQALPKRKGVPIDPAKDLGVFAMSATVGQLFGQVIYGAILDQYGTMTATGTQYNIWGFVAIYALGGLCFILSGVSTSYIKNVR